MSRHVIALEGCAAIPSALQAAMLDWARSQGLRLIVEKVAYSTLYRFEKVYKREAA